MRDICLLILLLGINLTQANAEPPPAESGAGIWTKRADGWSYHAQSGFSCPPTLVTTADKNGEVDILAVALTSVIVGTERQPPGSQVGCEYDGKDGNWASIEVTKMGPNESVSDHADATRKRIKAQYPDVMRESDLLNFAPKSPTGGRTYAVGYYNIRVGDRRASIVVVGGEVRGWMVTLIQFDYTRNATGLQVMASVNWQLIAHSPTRR